MARFDTPVSHIIRRGVIVGIARNTYYKYTRAEHPPEAANALANASTAYRPAAEAL